MDWKDNCKRAADVIKNAGALLIGTGAGMGVDSGLPDFRGTEGFWKAYPPFAKLGLKFSDAANPKWFFKKPAQAWGFYGHRYNLYYNTEPHRGFEVIRSWCEQKQNNYFVFTSNVDGHFQKCGFDDERIVECHGSLNHWQCTACCTDYIGNMSDFQLEVDEETFLAQDPLPSCSHCGDLARPNVLMFGDYQWIENRTQEQILRYNAWVRNVSTDNLVVVEIGAGKAVPTVRWECESHQAKLIRINPRDGEAPADGISIAAGGLEAILEIHSHLE